MCIRTPLSSDLVKRKRYGMYDTGVKGNFGHQRYCGLHHIKIVWAIWRIEEAYEYYFTSAGNTG